MLSRHILPLYLPRLFAVTKDATQSNECSCGRAKSPDEQIAVFLFDVALASDKLRWAGEFYGDPMTADSTCIDMPNNYPASIKQPTSLRLWANLTSVAQNVFGDRIPKSFGARNTEPIRFETHAQDLTLYAFFEGSP